MLCKELIRTAPDIGVLRGYWIAITAAVIVDDSNTGDLGSCGAVHVSRPNCC